MSSLIRVNTVCYLKVTFYLCSAVTQVKLMPLMLIWFLRLFETKISVGRERENKREVVVERNIVTPGPAAPTASTEGPRLPYHYQKVQDVGTES